MGNFKKNFLEFIFYKQHFIFSSCLKINKLKNDKQKEIRAKGKVSSQKFLFLMTNKGINKHFSSSK
jgi:hypothetical protein